MFAKKIKEFRTARGESMEEFGRLVGVKKTTVSNWESGRNYPNSDTLVLLAKLLGVTTDSLLGTDDNHLVKAQRIADTMADQQSDKAKELYQRMLDAGMDEAQIENYISITIAVTKKPTV